MSNEIQQKIPLIRRLRTYFLTGLVVAAPIAITIWVAIWFIESVDSWFSPFIPNSLKFTLQFTWAWSDCIINHFNWTWCINSKYIW